MTRASATLCRQRSLLRKRARRQKRKTEQRLIPNRAPPLREGEPPAGGIFQFHLSARELIDVKGRGAISVKRLRKGDCCQIFAGRWSRFIHSQHDPCSSVSDGVVAYFDDEAFTAAQLPIPSIAIERLPSQHQAAVFRTPPLADDLIVESPPERVVDVWGRGGLPLKNVQPGQFCRTPDGMWGELLGGYHERRNGQPIYVAHVRREKFTAGQVRLAVEGMLLVRAPRQQKVDVFGRGWTPFEEILPGECLRTTDGKWRELWSGYRERAAGGALGEHCIARLGAGSYTTERLIALTTPPLPRAFVTPVAPNVASKRVLNVFKNAPAPLLHVHYGDTMIRVTHNHPWFIHGKGWVASRDLLPGDMLQTLSGEGIAIRKVEDHGEIEPVYNIEVEDHHTYFVGGENGRGPFVLVHNTSPAEAAKRYRQLTEQYLESLEYDDDGFKIQRPLGERTHEIAPRDEARLDALEAQIKKRLEHEEFEEREEKLLTQKPEVHIWVGPRIGVGGDDSLEKNQGICRELAVRSSGSDTRGGTDELPTCGRSRRPAENPRECA